MNYLCQWIRSILRCRSWYDLLLGYMNITMPKDTKNRCIEYLDHSPTSRLGPVRKHSERKGNGLLPLRTKKTFI